MRVVAGLVVVAACSGDPPGPRQVVAAGPSTTVLAGHRPPPALRPASAAPVIQLTAAGEHACALHADHTVSCWGSNRRGELAARALPLVPEGLGIVVAHPTPFAIALADVLEVSTGADGTCARRADGVWCWGTTAPAPERIAGVTDAIAITPSCAIGMTGETRCWEGMLAADVDSFLADAMDIATHGDRTCVLRVVGEAECRVLAPGGDSPQVEVVAAGAASELALGADRLCVRRREGGVECAAYERYDRRWGPLSPVVGVERALQIAAGDGLACAREPDRIRCWGDLPGSVPAIVELRADEIAVGAEFVCARAGGDVACWGENAVGQLGGGWSAVHPAPIAVPGITDAVDVHVGARYTCARRRNDEVACWGLLRGEPTAVPVPAPGAAGAAQLAGSLELCTRNRAGAVRCDRPVGGAHAVVVPEGVVDFGKMYRGGAAVTADRAIVGLDFAYELEGVPEAIGVEVGNDAACFIRPDRTVACVGRHFGPVRMTQRADSSMTEIVEGLERVVDLAIGEAAGCALLDDASVRCWGDNTWGQVGRPGLAPTAAAVPVFGLGEVAQIAGSFDTTCARTAAGAVKCWGRNMFGVLGVDPGALVSSALPVAIPLERVVDVSVGQHACAVVASGAVWCWGLADKGQVGTFVSERSATPRPVAFPRALLR
jgi:alpha-tubulin suppressor-like RCC1 family protein